MYPLSMKNIFEQIPLTASNEIVSALLVAEQVRIERIVSFGQASPSEFWYNQAENEWFILLEGTAQLQVEDRLISLTAGDFLNLPSGTKHRVEQTDPVNRTVWLAVFYK